jgi:glycosyltransferase involved in cell wall biosynthesis
MRIGLLAYGLDRSQTGIQRYTVELARALSRIPGGPEIILLHTGLPHNLIPSGIRTQALAGCRRMPGLMTLGQFLISWYAGRLDLDVLHDPVGVVPFLFGGGRAKLVVTVHDLIPWSCPGTSTFLEKIVFRQWVPRMIRRVQAVITASEQSRADILRFLPVEPNRLHVLPYGSAECFHPSPAQEVGSRLSRRFDLTSDFVLSTGTASSRKNIGRLISAFSEIAGDFPGVDLVLVGSRKGGGTGSEKRDAAADRSNRILWTGPISDTDLADLYAGCRVFVFPSLYEGFGLPPLEAMACGAPVICSNAASLPEVVGGAARLVDPTDTRALRNAMREVLSNTKLQSEMREKSLRQARRFSWERNALQTMEVYRKVVYD